MGARVRHVRRRRAARRIRSTRRIALVDGRYVVTNAPRSRAGTACRSARSSATRRSTCSICAAAHARHRRGVVRRAAQAGRPVRVRRHAARVRARARHEGVGASRRQRPRARSRAGRAAGCRCPDSSPTLLRDRLAEAAARRVPRTRDEALQPLLASPARSGRTSPRADELLIEQVKTREGWHLFVYPFEGRLVHEGLAALLRVPARPARRRSRSPWRPTTTASSSCRRRSRRSRPRWRRRCFSPDNLRRRHPGGAQRDRDGAATVPRDRARGGAGVSGLSALGQDGAAAAGVERPVLRRVQRYDPGNLLLAQAHREVLERSWSAPGWAWP